METKANASKLHIGFEFNETWAPFRVREVEPEWPDWLWQPLLLITFFILFLTFLFLLHWQSEINRGRAIPGRLPHYHRVAVSSAEETN